jgi:DNA-binding LacI/PurR family transcriptional regulator
VNSGTWKVFERTVAEYFGTFRVPLSGSNSRHNTSSDSLHDRLYLEAKRDKKYFGAIISALVDGTEKKAKKESKIPVICLKRHGRKGFYMLIHSDDLDTVALIRRTQE